MLHTVMAFLPLAFLIVYALKTRKMADAMVLATLLAVLLVHRQHFFTGLIDAMYTTLGNSSYQFALCSILGFGGMISLFQASGGLMGFRDLLAKAANTPRKTLLLAWLLSVIMFVDEYLNALTTTICLRDVSDKNRLPREHLAVQTNIMACCLCVTVPFTSWTAFSVGLISDFGLGFTDYLQAVPFMFYPLAMMLVSLLLALGWFPKVGMLRQAYHRVASGGAAFEPGEKGEKLVDIDEVDEHNVSSAWNAVVPLAALVGGTVLFDNDLLHGIIVCMVVQFLLYVIQKRMTVGEYFAHFFSGVKGMTAIAVVVGFGLMLSDANRTLGLFDILINGIGGEVPRCLIAPLAFVLVGLTVFAVGGCWAVMTIAIPVFIPMGLAAGVAAPLMIAAVMSGVTLGYSLCFYADAVLMTTAGSGVSNLTTIRATTPYALAVGGLSVIALLVAGL